MTKDKKPTALVSIKPKIATLAVSKLRAAPWNYKLSGNAEEIEKLKNSILSSKSAGVLCVRELPKGTSKVQIYEVIDGNHRFEAVKEAGWKTVACENFGRISKAQAVVISRQRNWQWFKDDPILLGKLYTDDVLKMFSKDEMVDLLPEPIPVMDGIIAVGIAGAIIQPEPKGAAPTMCTVKLTAEQNLIFQQAVELLRESQGNPENISDGRALEFICADYIAGS